MAAAGYPGYEAFVEPQNDIVSEDAEMLGMIETFDSSVGNALLPAPDNLTGDPLEPDTALKAALLENEIAVSVADYDCLGPVLTARSNLLAQADVHRELAR